MEDKEFLERIGKNIAIARKAKGMTQQELAGKLGIQRTALTRIETGNVNTTLLVLKAIAVALGVKVEELVK